MYSFCMNIFVNSYKKKEFRYCFCWGPYILMQCCWRHNCVGGPVVAFIPAVACIPVIVAIMLLMSFLLLLVVGVTAAAGVTAVACIYAVAGAPLVPDVLSVAVSLVLLASLF
jgi:hypothetical protein